MDKNAIKKYAVWARTEMIARVSMKAEQYGITEDNMVDASADSVNGRVLSADEKKQRQALIAQIKEKGYRQVMEEVAYTWFNRFSALRFMEVNGYLPSHVRVFTDEENRFKPQILAEAIHLELDGLDMEKVYALKDAEKTDELYRYLLIVQCNALNKILPGMFQRIADYTELLLPDNLLRQGSVIEQMISMIPEEDWKDAVQIIGWLYQYYNTELNEFVYDGSYAREKIAKEYIPAATTIYTPDWAVNYMVENSLGHLWLEGHPDAKDQLLPTDEEQSAYADGNRDPGDTKWHYYLEEAEQEPEVQTQLEEIRKEYAALTPEQIKVIDPCCGSGHILVYLFDVLMQIYESYGYTTWEAVVSIVENNLYGLDIDDRAAQLAYFAVMMKARQYDRRFFSRGIQPHVVAIVESNHLDKYALDYFVNGDAKRKATMDTIVKELYDAKEYGSILTVTPQNWSALYQRFDEIRNDIDFSRDTALSQLLPLVQVAEALAQKYDVVVTNPPYLGSSRFNPALDNYVKKEYPEVKSDLSMVVLKKMLGIQTKENGFVSFITTNSWMCLSSFEKLRNYMLANTSLESIVDFGTELFDGKVGHNPVVAWVNRKSQVNVKMTAVRLVDFCYSRRDEKEPEFFNIRNRYVAKQDDFSKIPGAPIAYWVSSNTINAYDHSLSIDTISDFTGSQHKTADNDKYLRFWWEIGKGLIENRSWIFYAKGGEYRKWYGNIDLVVDWRDSAREFYSTNATSNMIKEKYWFAEGITYTSLTSSVNGFRYLPPIGVFDIKGPSIVRVENLEYCLGFFNSKVAMLYLKLLNPTITLQVKDVKNTPIIIDNTLIPSVNVLVDNNVEISKQDWNSFETSWDFQQHPLIRCAAFSMQEMAEDEKQHIRDMNYIEEAYTRWSDECYIRFNNLKSNEEELNRIFIDIYGLRDELTPEVEDKDVTVRKADLGRDIRSFISYAVGCMFGRYSLDEPGLAYAGGEWDAAKYATFPADKDNIIPICDDEYFEDDIVGRFVKFVETVYGADTLDENLKFIADALGGKGQPKDVIRNYFLNDFFNDHCKIYQKRPIYWQFDSGKKNGFKCLIYMHRYQPDTIARIRTDYVHEQQSRYRTAIEGLERQIEAASTSERVKLNKKLKTIQDQATELHAYEEKIHHLADQMIPIDLDDGVKVNYAKFQDVLAKIK